MRIRIGLLAAALLLGLTGAAGAEEECAMERKAPAFWRNEKLTQKLTLSPDQIERLEAEETTFQERRREISDRWEASRKEMKQILAEADFSPEEAQRVSGVIAGLAGQRAQLATDRQIAIRRILTAEQWAEVGVGRQRMGERMRRKMRGGPGGEAMKKGWLIDPEVGE